MEDVAGLPVSKVKDKLPLFLVLEENWMLEEKWLIKGYSGNSWLTKTLGARISVAKQCDFKVQLYHLSRAIPALSELFVCLSYMPAILPRGSLQRHLTKFVLLSESHHH